ncbi:hypothetical protein ES703_15976 [subsurface metagenome]
MKYSETPFLLSKAFLCLSWVLFLDISPNQFREKVDIFIKTYL